MLLEDIQQRLWSEFIPYLEKGRPGDVYHSRRAFRYGKRLCYLEGGDPCVVGTSLIGHDSGYGFLLEQFGIDLSDLRYYQRLHMGCGAYLMWKSLDKLTKESDEARTVFTEERKTEIFNVIASHDNPDDVFEWGNKNAIIVVEADRLDRYNVDRINDFRAISSSFATENPTAWLRQGLKEWFATNTGKSLANQLFKEFVEEMKEKSLKQKLAKS